MLKVDPNKRVATGDCFNQNDIIIKHVKAYGSINSVEAIQHYNIMRLAARVTELSGTPDAMRSFPLPEGFVEYRFDPMTQALNTLREITHYSDPAVVLTPAQRAEIVKSLAERYATYVEQASG